MSTTGTDGLSRRRLVPSQNTTSKVDAPRSPALRAELSARTTFDAVIASICHVGFVVVFAAAPLIAANIMPTASALSGALFAIVRAFAVPASVGSSCAPKRAESAPSLQNTVLVPARNE